MQTDHFFLGGNPGEPVPTVDMTDLKSVWTIYRDIESMHPGRKTAVDSTIIERACSTEVDIPALIYRLWMLGFLELLPGNLLDRCKKNERFDDVVFKVMAKMPMKWAPVGVPQSKPPFDVESFFDQLRQELPGQLCQ